MLDMKKFKQRIKEMCKTEENEIPEEKKYNYGNLKVVENTITGQVSICEVESSGYDYSAYRKIVANDIENGEQVLEYLLRGLPGGRCCFGGYTDKLCNTGKAIYNFQDVWYKIYGKFLKLGKEFTRDELLAKSAEIKEKFKETKYRYIYSIKSKNDNIKPLIQYLKDNEVKIFEIIDNKYILIDSYIVSSEMPELKFEQIESIGTSRVYTVARFTKEACTQIIDDYTKKIGQDER